jgi:hypothetical protein
VKKQKPPPNLSFLQKRNQKLFKIVYDFKTGNVSRAEQALSAKSTLVRMFFCFVVLCTVNIIMKKLLFFACLPTVV